MNELPVWSSEEVERSAAAVAALCREVGAVAWAVALAVLLVDGATVAAFREQQPAVWASFVQMLHADVTFSYLWDILEVLSGAADGEAGVAAGGGPQALAVAVEGLQLGSQGEGVEGLPRSEAYVEQVVVEEVASPSEAADAGDNAAAVAAAGLQLSASAGRVELRPLRPAGEAAAGGIQVIQEVRP